MRFARGPRGRGRPTSSSAGRTWEHIPCSALAMPLAGTLQRKTWHLSTQVSLSLATKAKSLRGRGGLSAVPAEAALR